MAYSRWGKDSVWYTFWSSICSSELEYKFPTKKLKHEQCFEICDYNPYYVTYGDLKERGIKQVVKEVQDFYKNEKRIQLSDYTKLRWQLVRFMTDIDDHFKWKNFFMHEWYYPIRNEIIFWFRKQKKI